jgi:hypothetical protein
MVSSYADLVLKDKFTLSNQDFNQLKEAQQFNKLYARQYNENERLKILKENKSIYNLSVNTLLKNLSTVLLEITNDVSVFINQDNKSFNSFFIIFTKKERLMYVGLLLVFISIVLWFIDITN